MMLSCLFQELPLAKDLIMCNVEKVSGLFPVLALAAILMAFTACASYPTVQSDYDYNADFSLYRTYGYFNPLEIEGPDYSTIYGAIFRKAIDVEMQSRGYVKSKKPDLLINVSGNLNKKISVSNTGHAHLGGFHGAPGGNAFGSSGNASQFPGGTIAVDLVDRAEKRMVWEGIAPGLVTTYESNDESRASIRACIQGMFAEYPFRAGQ